MVFELVLHSLLSSSCHPFTLCLMEESVRTCTYLPYRLTPAGAGRRHRIRSRFGPISQSRLSVSAPGPDALGPLPLSRASPFDVTTLTAPAHASASRDSRALAALHAWIYTPVSVPTNWSRGRSGSRSSSEMEVCWSGGELVTRGAWATTSGWEADAVRGAVGPTCPDAV